MIDPLQELIKQNKIVSNEREQRQQWLNGLQIGDEVAVDRGSRTYHIGKITRITPTRRFTVEGKGCTFGSDGVEMGAHNWGHSRNRMYLVTEEIKQAIVRKDAIQYINAYLRVDNLNTQQLLSILNIIQINNDET